MLQSLTPRYTSSSFSSLSHARASCGERRSGCVTISHSGVPARLRSIRLSPVPAASSCMLFPASSSRCTRMMPTRRENAPFGSTTSSQPSLENGRSYWLI